MNLNWIIYILILFQYDVYCEQSTTINEQLQSYKRYLNASLKLDRQDKSLVSNWTLELQVKQVNITSFYRLQVARHKDHCFKKNANHKWEECKEIYKIAIAKPEVQYYLKENECLKEANSEGQDQRDAVNQLQKEIRHWRKGYKYLNNLCNINNPDNSDEAGTCLVEYMEKDNYSHTIQRLLILKLEAMGNFYSTITESVIKLDRCLRLQYSKYLDKVRSVMEILNKCYGTK